MVGRRSRAAPPPSSPRASGAGACCLQLAAAASSRAGRATATTPPSPPPSTRSETPRRPRRRHPPTAAGLTCSSSSDAAARTPQRALLPSPRALSQAPWLHEGSRALSVRSLCWRSPMASPTLRFPRPERTRTTPRRRCCRRSRRSTRPAAPTQARALGGLVCAAAGPRRSRAVRGAIRTLARSARPTRARCARPRPPPLAPRLSPPAPAPTTEPSDNTCLVERTAEPLLRGVAGLSHVLSDRRHPATDFTAAA
mmetsp:Transcript_9468/g.27673  ORF Transcript_9468/g.27673 Transcript_9468/m.27673 type:complete len:254 (-) Transcript_9468:354-1115(-)